MARTALVCRSQSRSKASTSSPARGAAAPPGTVAETPREPANPIDVLRQALGLALLDHLDRVLDVAQERVCRAERSGLVARDHLAALERIERRQRAAHADGIVVTSVNELKHLHDELELTDAAGAELDVAHVPHAHPPKLLLRVDALLHPPKVFDRLVVEMAPEDEGTNTANEGLAEREISGDGSRLDVDAALPGIAPPLVVDERVGDRVDDRPAAALRAQPQIDAEDEPVFGRVADHVGDGRREPREELVCDRRVVTHAIAPVVVRHVDVRAVVEVLAAELAETEDDERNRRAVDGDRVTALARERDAAARGGDTQRGLGERCDRFERLGKSRSAEKVARADAKHLSTRNLTQRARDLVDLGVARDGGESDDTVDARIRAHGRRRRHRANAGRETRESAPAPCSSRARRRGRRAPRSATRAGHQHRPPWRAARGRRSRRRETARPPRRHEAPAAKARARAAADRLEFAPRSARSSLTGSSCVALGKKATRRRCRHEATAPPRVVRSGDHPARAAGTQRSTVVRDPF